MQTGGGGTDVECGSLSTHRKP